MANMIILWRLKQQEWGISQPTMWIWLNQFWAFGMFWQAESVKRQHWGANKHEDQLALAIHSTSNDSRGLRRSKTVLFGWYCKKFHVNLDTLRQWNMAMGYPPFKEDCPNTRLRPYRSVSNGRNMPKRHLRITGTVKVLCDPNKDKTNVSVTQGSSILPLLLGCFNYDTNDMSFIMWSFWSHWTHHDRHVGRTILARFKITF